MSMFDFEIITLILCTICHFLLFRSVKNLYDEFLRQLWSWQSYIYRWVREELDRAASNSTR